MAVDIGRWPLEDRHWKIAIESCEMGRDIRSVLQEWGKLRWQLIT